MPSSPNPESVSRATLRVAGAARAAWIISAAYVLLGAVAIVLIVR